MWPSDQCRNDLSESLSVWALAPNQTQVSHLPHDSPSPGCLCPSPLPFTQSPSEGYLRDSILVHPEYVQAIGSVNIWSQALHFGFLSSCRDPSAFDNFFGQKKLAEFRAFDSSVIRTYSFQSSEVSSFFQSNSTSYVGLPLCMDLPRLVPCFGRVTWLSSTPGQELSLSSSIGKQVKVHIYVVILRW